MSSSGQPVLDHMEIKLLICLRLRARSTILRTPSYYLMLISVNSRQNRSTCLLFIRSFIQALRTEFNLELENLMLIYTRTLLSQLRTSCITMFKLQELNGVCLLDVNSHLSATVDRTWEAVAQLTPKNGSY